MCKVFVDCIRKYANVIAAVVLVFSCTGWAKKKKSSIFLLFCLSSNLPMYLLHVLIRPYFSPSPFFCFIFVYCYVHTILCTLVWQGNCKIWKELLPPSSKSNLLHHPEYLNINIHLCENLLSSILLHSYSFTSSVSSLHNANTGRFYC
jgi:hypothetical protein